MTNKSNEKNISKYHLLTCNCESTIRLDANKLAKNLGIAETPQVYHDLCRTQVGNFEQTMSEKSGSKVIITCTQEAPLFKELAANIYSDMDEPAELTFVNIREQAGWGQAGKKASAKIAALIAEAKYDVQPARILPVTSNGNCIVYGAGQQAMDVAKKLAGHLNISLILTKSDDVYIPAATVFPVHQGEIRTAKGSIGKFSVVLNNYAAVSPSSKSELEFIDSRNDVCVETDLIFDLSGGDPLLGGQHGRDGYVHVDPSQPLAIAEAMFEIVDLVGEFEKTLFVSYDQSICAHARSGQTGCSNCIDNCPTSAISSHGDGIVVNNEICDGCGHCSSSCPTGAIAYAFPTGQDLIGRAQVLLKTYLHAQGKHPVLLVHEDTHGGEIISAISRFGQGLEENIIPFGVYSVTQIGHDILTAFFTAGAQTVIVLVGNKKKNELDAINFQIELTNAFLTGMGFDAAMQVQLLIEEDPDLVSESLQTVPKIKTPAVNNFMVGNNKRQNARLAIGNLNAAAPEKLELLDLPTGSPYGSISIDCDKCTLCLACVGSCPAGALSDNEDRPQVSFIEHSCVQCGLCKTTCPENAISMKAQFNFDKSALSPEILNTEEPLDCTRCGKPFGSKSAIEKVIGILQGKNPMFQTSEQMALLKMCENCRVIAMAETEKDPMTFGTVPRVMTATDISPEDDEPTKH